MLTEWNMYVKENYHRVSHLPNKERLKALSDMRKNTNSTPRPAKQAPRPAKQAPKAKARPEGRKAKVSGGMLSRSDINNIIEQVFDKFDKDFGGFQDREVYSGIREILIFVYRKKEVRDDGIFKIEYLLDRLMPGNSLNPVWAASIANDFFDLIETNS
jgi:hypothetical protein